MAAVHSEDLVEVFQTNDDSEALVVRGLLESNSIEVMMTSAEAPAGVFPFSNSPMGHMRLEVRASQAEEARAIINDYRRPGRPQTAA